MANKSRKSRPFTLLEIVVVLALVAVVATLGIGALRSLLEKHQFQSEIDHFKSMLSELQIEALALNSDMEMTLTKSKKGWTACSKTAESILHSETIPMKNVKDVFFNDHPVNKIELNIFSTGRIEPAALIEIKGDKETVWIDLRQPIQIKFSTEKPKLVQKPLPKKPKDKHATHEFSV